MTEKEWLKCNDPWKMIEDHYASAQRSSRKWRLFACAGCRLFWSVLPDGPSRRAIEVAELYADRSATRQELAAARAAVLVRAGGDSASQWASNAASFAAAASPLNAATWVYSASAEAAVHSGKKGETQRATHRFALVALLRHIFGNPFRPVTLDPSWLTPTVTSLAQAAYEERALPSGELDTARLVVLSDALEEAGCDNADILNHLRGAGPHVRGCWVVDLLLGKE